MHLLVDHDGGRLPRLRRQLDPGHRRVDQAARAASALARYLPHGNRGAGTEWIADSWSTFLTPF